MRVQPTGRVHDPVAICHAGPPAATRLWVLTLGRLSVLATLLLCLSFLFLAAAAATPFLCPTLAPLPLPLACVGARLPR
jgi:hypothetical protein